MALPPPLQPTEPRDLYLSNLSGYSGVVEDAVPVLYSKSSLSIVPAQEVFHTPRGLPTSESVPDQPAPEAPVQDGYPQHIPFLRLKKSEEPPLDSPPKDITMVSNYESLIDSADADAIIKNRLHYEKQQGTVPEVKTVLQAVTGVIHQSQPIASVNGSIVAGSGSEHLSSLTSSSTGMSYGHNLLQIVTDTIAEERTPEDARKASFNQLNTPTMSGKPDARNYVNRPSLRVPTKNITIASAAGPQGYYATRDLHYGTGAYSNSLLAGETMTSSKDNGPQNPLQMSPPTKELTIPPRSPDRPIPENSSYSSLENKTFLNTLRNSDLRAEPAETTPGLGFELRPPAENNMVQQDLDLTDDEQITSLINEMRLRLASGTAHKLRRGMLDITHLMPRPPSVESVPNKENFHAAAASAASEFVKNLLNYHHKRYKSDLKEDEPERMASKSLQATLLATLQATLRLTRNDSIQTETPLVVKKRSKASVRPLPTPPGNKSEEKPSEAVSMEDLAAELDREIVQRDRQPSAVSATTICEPEPKKDRLLKKMGPFDRESIARLLEATEGTVIGQEFQDLELPSDEKRLLERIVDSLSRLTADMIADPSRHNEGIRRLGNALRALEGFE